MSLGRVTSAGTLCGTPWRQLGGSFVSFRSRAKGELRPASEAPRDGQPMPRLAPVINATWPFQGGCCSWHLRVISTISRRRHRGLFAILTCRSRRYGDAQV